MTSPVARDSRVAERLSQPRSFGELDGRRRVAVSLRPCNWFQLPTAVGTRPQKECGGRSVPDSCLVPTFPIGRVRADPRVVS